jgi:hypothetical protein
MAFSGRIDLGKPDLFKVLNSGDPLLVMARIRAAAVEGIVQRREKRVVARIG